MWAFVLLLYNAVPTSLSLLSSVLRKIDAYIVFIKQVKE